MKFINGHTHTVTEQEPIVTVKLDWDDVTGELDIIGTTNRSDVEWVIASLTPDGKLQPNGTGCSHLGIKIDNKFAKAL